MQKIYKKVKHNKFERQEATWSSVWNILSLNETL